jgi:hypothetical protein
LHSACHTRVEASYRARMAPVDLDSTREFLEAVIAGFSVLGGVMAYFSGFAASTAISQGRPPSEVAHKIDRGLAFGFNLGAPAAILALMIMGA